MLKDECTELKKDLQELEQANKILKGEKIELDMENLFLHEDLNRIKETLNLKEESFETELTRLEKKSLDLKQKMNPYLLKTKICMKN